MDFSNIFVILFLTGTVGQFVLNNVLEFIDFRFRKKNGRLVPSELEGYIDQEKLEKTVEYEDAKYFLWLPQTLCSFVLTLALVFSRYYNLIYIWLWRATFNPYVTGFLFFFFASLPAEILSIPFSLYKEFVLEKKFGFSTTTFGLWLKDQLISLVFGFIIDVVLVCAMVALMKFVPQNWWIFLGAVYLVLSLSISFVYPIWIAPLFNKFTPVEDGELKERITGLMEKSGFKASGIFIMDASKRSRHSNAYFTGFGKNKRIVLYDTLVQQLDVDEIEAVLGHELGHYKHKHVLKRMCFMVPVIFIALFVVSLLVKIPELYTAMGFTPDFMSDGEGARMVMFPAQVLGIFITSLVFGGYSELAGLVTNCSSRHDEFQADAYAKKMCGSGKPLSTGLIKLNRENLSEITVPKIYAVFNYNHPPLLERIKAVEDQ